MEWNASWNAKTFAAPTNTPWRSAFQKSVKRDIKNLTRSPSHISQTMNSRYQKITSLVIALKKTVHDPTTEIESSTILQNDIRILFESLVHSLTIINKLYRQKDREGNYISQREDYATALMLISPLFTAGKLDISGSIRTYYQILVDEIGISSSFNWRDLQALTGKSKTSCNRILQGLRELNLIRKNGKGYRQLQNYELIPTTETHQTAAIWESAFEDFKDFKGWQEF